MEYFTIETALLLIGLAILYKLYGPNSAKDQNTEGQAAKDQNVTNMASKAAKEAAREALTEVLATNTLTQEKDWKSYKKDIDSSIKPISTSVEDLDNAIKELQKERKQELGSLEAQITTLLSTSNNLRDETTTLSQALKSSSVQGKWGEVQLRNIVEQSGMINHVDFEEQKGTETGDSIPDMVINLPNGGIIPIDSKCPMNDFRESLEEEDETRRVELQKSHAKRCRTHMKSLSSKKYHEQYDNPIDFVIMLIPFEPGFQAALMHDGNLFNDGSNLKVFIVSPISIMPLLNLVSETWRQMSMSKNATEIITMVKELSKRFKTHEEFYDKVGDRITSLGTAYNKSVSSYNSRLKPSIRDIQELQGLEEDDKQLESVNLDIKPVLQRVSIDTEDTDTNIEEE